MTEPYRILVTGSRDWPTPGTVWEAISLAGAQCRGTTITVVHGGCKTGADAHASEWCRKHPAFGLGMYVVEEIHRADFSHGRAAGPWRNRRMVEAGATVCLAFIALCARPGCPQPQPHGSHGASGCADFAEKAGIKVRRFED